MSPASRATHVSSLAREYAVFPKEPVKAPQASTPHASNTHPSQAAKVLAAAKVAQPVITADTHRPAAIPAFLTAIVFPAYFSARSEASPAACAVAALTPESAQSL